MKAVTEEWLSSSDGEGFNIQIADRLLFLQHNRGLLRCWPHTKLSAGPLSWHGAAHLRVMVGWMWVWCMWRVSHQAKATGKGYCTVWVNLNIHTSSLQKWGMLKGDLVPLLKYNTKIFHSFLFFFFKVLIKSCDIDKLPCIIILYPLCSIEDTVIICNCLPTAIFCPSL